MKKLCMGLLVLPFLFACGTKVERLDTHEIKDVSGRWNDTDSQMVAQEMINDCLNSGWYNKATLRLGKEPTVIVGTVTNDSMEHINTNAFVEEMQRALINSGSARRSAPGKAGAGRVCLRRNAQGFRARSGRRLYALGRAELHRGFAEQRGRGVLSGKYETD